MMRENNNISEINAIPTRINFDILILNYIKNKMSHPVADKLMIFFTRLGDGGIVWGLIGLVLLFQEKHRNSGKLVIMTMLLTAFVGEIVIKNIAKRLRPCHCSEQDELLVKKPISYSFPSGHTASSFAVAGVLTNIFGGYAIIFFAIAILIAFSRVYLFVHYPTDIFAGMILGILCCQASIHYLTPLL